MIFNILKINANFIYLYKYIFLIENIKQFFFNNKKKKIIIYIFFEKFTSL